MAQRTPPIKGSTHSFERIRRAFLMALAPIMCSCALPVAGANPTGETAISTITEITLERDCGGCTTGSTLVLRSDGTARLTVTGNARMGTVDQVSSGTLRRDEFEMLARLALAQGFFALDEVYEDPTLRDGAWTTTTVVRGGKAKRVFRREDAAPAGLRAVEAAIDALRARIEFVPMRR